MAIRRRLFRLLAAAMLCCACGAAAAARMLCEPPAIFVQAQRADEASLACEAIRRAVPFLRSSGLAPPATLELVVVDCLSKERLEPHELGCFSGATGKALVRSRSQMAAGRLPWTVPITSVASPAVWGSYVAHEFAHATLWADTLACRPDAVIFEYVAAVVQIAVLPEDVRAALLADYASVGAFDDPSTIDLRIFEMNPKVFAVMSYRHYLAQTDGPGYLGRLAKCK